MTADEQALDAKWFPRLRDVYEGVPARLVIQGYNEARERFLRGEDVCPVFSYCVNDDQNYRSKHETLLQLQADIENDTQTPEAIKRLYLDKIFEKRSLLDLVRYSHLLLNAPTETDRAALAGQYRDISKKVFGAVEPDVFVHACTVLFGQLKAVGSIDEPDAYRRTYDLLQRITAAGTSIESLHIEVPGEPGLIITDQAVIKARFEAALAEHNLSHWTVQYGNKTRTGFVVKPKSRRIVIPNATALQSRRLGSELTEQRLQGLIAHELTHVLRYENGLRSPLQLLAVGLAGYLRGEEGYATYREQVIAGADDYSGNKLYVAAGLAAGLDRGGESRNFREVYELMKELYQALHPNEDFRADLIAFKLCATLFKGTNGVDRGVFLTLQTCYREGNMRVHETLRALPVWHQYALLGKFDFTNATHVQRLQNIGVLPATIG